MLVVEPLLSSRLLDSDPREVTMVMISQEEDADQEEDDADQEEDVWNNLMYFDVIVFLMTILQASTGQQRWRSNLVKPQMLPSVFQTVFPPVEI